MKGRAFGQWWFIEKPVSVLTDLSTYQLSPKVAAALWRLKLLNIAGIKKIAMHWLENGAESYEVAALAGEPGNNFFICSKLFEKSLADMGVNELPSERDAVITAMRFVLSLIANREIEPFEGMQRILNDFDRSEYKVFSERDPRISKASRSKSGRYAGQDLGIEHLFGIYYSQDDIVNITASDLEEIKKEIVREAKIVLKRYNKLT